MRKDTLLFLLNDERGEVLLAMKKRGFGVGKLNGVGGKVTEGETVPGAAVREAKEEIGVAVQEDDLVQVAELNFHFENKPEWDINCHIFFARAWEGLPEESEEMSPQWFDRDALPYERMWVDDKYWLPMVLQGNYVEGMFIFTEDGSEIVRFELKGAPRK